MSMLIAVPSHSDLLIQWQCPPFKTDTVRANGEDKVTPRQADEHPDGQMERWTIVRTNEQIDGRTDG